MNYNNLLKRTQEDMKEAKVENKFVSDSTVVNSIGTTYTRESEEDKIKECAVCFELKFESYFRYYNRERKIRQWACIVCHNKIDDYNKGKCKNGIKSDDWVGRFATDEAKTRHYNKEGK